MSSASRFKALNQIALPPQGTIWLTRSELVNLLMPRRPKARRAWAVRIPDKPSAGPARIMRRPAPLALMSMAGAVPRLSGPDPPGGPEPQNAPSQRIRGVHFRIGPPRAVSIKKPRREAGAGLSFKILRC